MTLRGVPRTTNIPDATKYQPIAIAFSDIHSGAAPATGSSSMLFPMPPSFTISQQAVRILVLSTQEPVCKTGGIPTVSHISFNPSPANLNAASGVKSPAFAHALPEHPVCTTRTSFFISSFTISAWHRPDSFFGLSHPTTPATPLILPLIIASFKGLYDGLKLPPRL